MKKDINEKSFFQIKEKGSTVTREILAGVVVFLAMIYILPTNVSILSATGMDEQAIFIATALASGIATLIMGLVAKFPVVLSAGMGMNAFFAYTVCGSMGYSWQEALTVTLISGIIFLLITITPLRKKIIEAIPIDLRNSIIVGLGAFIALVGLKTTGIIQGDVGTLVTLGDFTDPSVLLALFGVILVFIFLNIKGRIQSFGIAISMGIVAIVGLILGLCGVEGMPKFDFSGSSVTSISKTFGQAFLHFDVLARPETYAIIFSFVFVNLFDTTGTLIAVGKGAGIINEQGELSGGKKAMLADASGAVISGILGTSPVTSFVESNVGVELGGRTGLTAVTAGVLFLISIFAYPIFSIFTSASVTGMALIAVGAMMFKDLKNINWDDKIVVFTTFLMIILMILTYSISDGLGLGLIFYCVMMLAAKRGKEVNKVVYFIALFFMISFAVDAIITIL